MDALERPVSGLHGTSNDTVCKTDTIAPHIHVLYRDIPFILNITSSALCESMGQGFLIDELRLGRSWGGGIAYQDRTRQEAESERHMDVTSESW